MGEVEAQLVRADVRAGLAHVVAEPRAQRGVQQVRGGVVGLRSRGARRGRRCATTRSPACGVPRVTSTTQRLVVARAHDAVDAQLAVAVLAGDDAGVADLAAALGVERGLGELDPRAPVLLAHAADDGVRLELLVAGEGRRLGRQLAHDLLGLARPSSPAAADERVRCSPIRRSNSSSPLNGTPRSAAISRVSSIGKPNVSCRRNASSAPSSPGVEQVVEQLRALTRACGGSPPPPRVTHLRIDSRPPTSSG